MDKNNGTTMRKNNSDFEHLKVWKDNPRIDYYLSENHWNFHVNTAFHRLLSGFYNDEGFGGVGEYVDFSINSSGLFSQSKTIDYNPLYGRMLNEAYRLCNIVLTSPVPEITIPKLFQEAETMNFRNKKLPIGRSPQPSVIEQILSYHIIGMVNAILSLANCQTDAIDRFLFSLSIYQKVGLPYFGEPVRFDYYYKKYEQFVVVGLTLSSSLRTGYDYKGQDKHLRKKIVWYKIIAEELEKKRKEADNEKPKRKKKPEKVRKVDIETIGNHFRREFDKTTHLLTLKLFLEQPQSDKELARVALLIYKSQWFISGDYAVFSEWYKDFCRLVGCDSHESYEPNKLTPSEELKNKYYFLL